VARRFQGTGAAQALQRVKAELGPEAIILGAQRTAAGVEVIAAPPGESFERGETITLRTLAEEIGGLKGLITTHLLAAEAPWGGEAVSPAQEALGHLLSQEVDPELAGRMLAPLINAPAEEIKERLVKTMAGALGQSDPLRPGSAGPRLVYLVGPTGVGKTTTVAKLAARAALGDGWRVGLLTIDTYRVGAPEQLKVYGRIMGLPVVVAERPEDVLPAVETLRRCQIILVDTAGRSPADAAGLAAMNRYLEAGPQAEVLLCLAANTRGRDLETVIRRFRDLPLTGLIFTKIDESNTYGHLFTQAVRLALPVTHLTCGQRVPEDILPASPERVARLVLRRHQA
jgi:flagellar biosynthesis protein FlhF